jgi:putative ABC transport system permease protein
MPLRSVTEDDVQLLGLSILEGRNFRSTDTRKAPGVAIINQALVERYFPHANPIGKKLWGRGRDQPPVEIVGVVANGRMNDLTEAAAPDVYLPLWQASAFRHLVVRTAADALRHGRDQRTLHSVDPTAAVET